MLWTGFLRRVKLIDQINLCLSVCYVCMCMCRREVGGEVLVSRARLFRVMAITYRNLSPTCILKEFGVNDLELQFSLFSRHVCNITMTRAKVPTRSIPHPVMFLHGSLLTTTLFGQCKVPDLVKQ